MSEFKGTPSVFEGYTRSIKHSCEAVLHAQAELENAFNAHLPYWSDNIARDCAKSILAASQANKTLYNKAREKLDFAVTYYNRLLTAERANKHFTCRLEQEYVVRINEGDIAKMNRDMSERNIVINLNTMGDFIVKLKAYIHKAGENRELLARSCNGWESSFKQSLEGEIQSISRKLEQELQTLDRLAKTLDVAYDELMWIDIMGGKS